MNRTTVKFNFSMFSIKNKPDTAEWKLDDFDVYTTCDFL